MLLGIGEQSRTRHNCKSQCSGIITPGLSAAAGDTVRLLHQESNAYLCRPALPPTSVGLLPRGEGMASQVSAVPVQMWQG